MIGSVSFDGQTFWCPKNTHLWETLQKDGIHEPLVLDYLDGAVSDDMTCAVIGAQFGYITIYLAKRVKQVMAFEPMPKYLHILRRNIRANNYGNVTVIPAPVFSRRERGRMIKGQDRFMEDPAGDLRSVTLGGEFDLVEIHAEGASYEILRGAKTLLKERKPILVIAVHHKLLRRRYGRRASELRGFLERRGYSIDIIPEPKYPEYWAAVPKERHMRCIH